MEPTPPKQPTGSHPATGNADRADDGLAAGDPDSAGADRRPARWVAQLDRRLGIRSIAGGLALVLALAAGIVGVVLAMDAKDESATKTEVKSLSERVSANTEEATQAVKDELQTLTDRLDALEGRVSTVASSQRTADSEIKVAQDDIDELRGQITDLETQIDAAARPPRPATTAAASSWDVGGPRRGTPMC